jgi:hypothetical protein
MQGGPICHPAYNAEPIAEPEFDTIYDARALGNAPGFLTTFTRAERVIESRAHTHMDAFGRAVTHEHSHAGTVHAHSYPTFDRHRVKEFYGT